MSSAINITIPLLTPCCGKPVEPIELERTKMLETNRECVCGTGYRVYYTPGKEPEWQVTKWPK